MRLSLLLAVAAVPLFFLAAVLPAAATRATVTVDAAAPGKAVSPTLYGVFFEDINYAADGGLYPELVQNRSFEFYRFSGMGWPVPPDPMRWTPTSGWQTVQSGGANVEPRVEIARGLNANNASYLRLDIAGEGGEGGVSNDGFNRGMRVDAGATYDLSLFAAWDAGEAAPLRVALQTADGQTLAQARLDAPGRDWRKLAAALTPSRDADDARLVITTPGKGTLLLDMVSLFPRETFKNRPNGLRPDLAQAVADLKPKTLRFPGGCIVHGTGLANAYRWKDTVGPLEGRKYKENRWGYFQSYGLGFFEYFQLAEDVGATPLPILPVGVSCGFEKPYDVAGGAELDGYVRDALDLVEFANGGVDTTWGKVRADMGHPAPFDLKYLGLGNEEHDTAEVRAIYGKFVDAMRAAHPEIVLVGTSGLGAEVPLYDLMKDNDIPISDEHYYESPEWFVANQNRFDTFGRDGPKVYVGEYASRGNNLVNAVAEATYLTGIERNADAVAMTAYAPLMNHYDFTQWGQANLIHFDDRRVVLTPSYHVQRMFSANVPDRVLPTRTEFDGEALPLGVTAGVDEERNQYVVKIANPTDTAVTANVKLTGAAAAAETASVELLTGGRDATNTRERPDAVAPETAQIPAGASFDVEVPAMSVQVIRVGR